MSSRLSYLDLPWLSAELLEQLLADAYELGESKFRHYPAADGGVDWDDVMIRLEAHLPRFVDADGLSAECVLPLTYEHPLMRRIKKAYRKGFSENNE